MKAELFMHRFTMKIPKKVVEAIAGENAVDLIDATKEKERDLSGYDLIGFASGYIMGNFIRQYSILLLSIYRQIKMFF